MELAIFAKRGQTRDGRNFYRYLSTLHKRDGEAVIVTVKFADGAGTPKPEACPMNIEVEKTACNLSSRTYVNEAGEHRDSKTLWVNEWKPGAPYVDHSLDDFDF